MVKIYTQGIIKLTYIIKKNTPIKVIFKNIVYYLNLDINLFLIFELININSSVIFNSNSYIIQYNNYTFKINYFSLLYIFNTFNTTVHVFIAYIVDFK